MSNIASWSYTAQATIWRNLGKTESGDPIGYMEPEVILCDYEGGLSRRIANVSASLGDLGSEVVIKNTFWTEYDQASTGDYLLIGISTELDPITAGADEIRQIIRYADTFERVADDYAILTGV